MLIKYILTLSTIISILQSVLGVKVKLTQGTLNGVELKSQNNETFHGFLGIPFAKPPVGELRFKDPEPHTGWTGERDASKDPEICIQEFIGNFKGSPKGSEDCLYLNVFTPTVTPEKALPVMVFIHGGGYSTGDATTYKPDYFMDKKNIVLVIIQYRLGVFGFLSFGDEEVPGNFGLKDQTLALKWVKDNIDNFGGDPKSVTIFGESAGGGSVGLQLISPMAKGLFHKAILESGTQDCMWATGPLEVAKKIALNITSELGCPITSTRESIECLRNVSNSEKFLEADAKLNEWLFLPMVRYRPVIEDYDTSSTNSNNKFIPDHPKNLPHHKIPIIVGFNQHEGSLFASLFCDSEFKTIKEMNADFENRFMLTLVVNEWLNHEDKTDVVNKLKQFYIKGENKIDANNFEGFINAISDIMFVYCGLETTARHLSSSEQTYLYIYNFTTSFSYKKLFGHCPLTENKVGHADELLQLFRISLPVNISTQLSSPEEFKMSSIMIDLWTSFATTGAPQSSDLKVEWTPIKNSQNMEYLQINNDDIRMKLIQDSTFKERHNFIHSIKSLANYTDSDYNRI